VDIDAQGIAALDRRIRFGGILQLFFAGVGISFLAMILCAAFDAPRFARGLVGIAAQGLSWICGYQLLAYDRNWISLRERFSTVHRSALWACAAVAIALILFFLATEKILAWSGIKLPPLPAPDFLLGGRRWLPATFLMVAIIGPAAEELVIRGLLLDWLRQKMAVWQAILTSALIFGLLHGVAFHSGASGLLQLSFRIALGVMFAYLAVRYRSLLPSFVLHATFNGLAVVAVALLA
jgi:membrane protease YdiL (CAAX protease family)